MSINWSLEMLERDLNRLYDEILNLDDLDQLKAEQGKLATIFLSKAEQYFRVNYRSFGHQLNYSYYFQDKLFAEINLLQCPHFEDREKYLKWFVEQIRNGREYLQLSS
ncbi:hypothetical protein [Acinetobacter oleivorans]|uniref:hypothetical protein n=1 Tax=Acinetobacter oleivorans TaxID=1148157 RepID=UPI0015812AA0|nr:hypothetical protein [Acinetobacter oleivorans]NUG02226.1 hypothetical protein [Acinetobacter oleivorans]